MCMGCIRKCNDPPAASKQQHKQSIHRLECRQGSLIKGETLMREAKSANFTIASLLYFLTAVIASLPITGAAFGQENNFVLSSSAFADDGTMSQKYMGEKL